MDQLIAMLVVFQKTMKNKHYFQQYVEIYHSCDIAVNYMLNHASSPSRKRTLLEITDKKIKFDISFLHICDLPCICTFPSILTNQEKKFVFLYCIYLKGSFPLTKLKCIGEGRLNISSAHTLSINARYYTFLLSRTQGIHN